MQPIVHLTGRRHVRMGFIGAAYGVLALMFTDSVTAPDNSKATACRASCKIRSGAPFNIVKVDFLLDTPQKPKTEKKPVKRRQNPTSVDDAPSPDTATGSSVAPAVPSNRVEALRAAAPTLSGASSAASAEAIAVPASTESAAEHARSALHPTPASSAYAQSSTIDPTATSYVLMPIVLPTVVQPPVKIQLPSEIEANKTLSANGESQATPDKTSDKSMPRKLTRKDLATVIPGAWITRTDVKGVQYKWVDNSDGSVTVAWASNTTNKPQKVTGTWRIADDGRFCLHVSWPDAAEDWCRFLSLTRDGVYQPVAENADASWSPPADDTSWRPFTIQ